MTLHFAKNGRIKSELKAHFSIALIAKSDYDIMLILPKPVILVGHVHGFRFGTDM